MWSYELLRFHNIYAFFAMTYLFLFVKFFDYETNGCNAPNFFLLRKCYEFRKNV